MKLKSSLVALVSASALAGASTVLFSSEAQACFLNKFKDGFNASGSNNSLNLTAKQPDFNKMAIIGGAVATLAGLSVGGMALKTRLLQGKSQTEPSSEESFAQSNFAIVVPPEALTSSSIEETSELKHPLTK